MEKKQFEMSFYKEDGTFLESRQCSHFSAWQADFEAKLYADWAGYHYRCKVVFKITER